MKIVISCGFVVLNRCIIVFYNGFVEALSRHESKSESNDTIQVPDNWNILFSQRFVFLPIDADCYEPNTLYIHASVASNYEYNMHGHVDYGCSLGLIVISNPGK
jgi:hypothetical protein